jgi:hypothetical protein
VVASVEPVGETVIYPSGECGSRYEVVGKPRTSNIEHRTTIGDAANADGVETQGSGFAFDRLSEGHG